MQDPTPHILVCDDHRDIRELLARYLAKQGYRVTTAENAAALDKALRAGSFDLVVLDVMMPGEDGLSVTRRLRATTDLPVILLTAVAEETDRIVGLELGADDYVTKPFNPRELLARIKAVLRRVQTLPPRAEAAVQQDTVRLGPWSYDQGRQTLENDDGRRVELSTAEHKLLQALILRPGLVLTRDQLLDITSGREAKAFDRAIDNQISRLRRKIEPDPKRPSLIKTHRGGGYSLNVKVEPA